MRMLINKGMLVLGSILLIVCWSSCRSDFDFEPSQGELRFSKDTVYLDTLFSNIGSSTYTLKVFNTSDKNLSIPSIALSLSDSKYRLNIDGMSGNSFENVELLAKDSMYVFIETTLDIKDFTTTQTQFLYTDKLVFNHMGATQSVDLVTLVHDAVFLYPKKYNDGTYEFLELGTDDDGNPIAIEGFYLNDSELVFTNNKPYVIYGYAAVPSNKTVVFEAGARVHFHENSGLIAANNSTVLVQGLPGSQPDDTSNKVIFEGDRLESNYEDLAGQWGTIWLTAGSTAHSFNHCIIKNATVGILSDYNDESGNPTLTLKNTEIYNSEAYGLWAKTSHIDAENCVFGNAGQSVFYGNIGGKYNFRHCTFANYWNQNFRDNPAVWLDNYLELADGSYYTAPLEQATFENCMITGSQPIEWRLDSIDTTDFQFRLSHTLLQFNDTSGVFSENSLYSIADTTKYDQITLNGIPDFKSPNNLDFRIGIESDAIGKGNTAVSNLVPLDILDTSRTASPDLGAYQHIEFDD
ncbi:MAG: hypothetical protein P8L72_06750 [Flavobacteriaceae bacterium]|nr:hypothetical protein [Flavobacteriaceae bacterium]MDG2315053.1 hypothetical protein [Flavobacteriaceae bacterium]